MSTLAVCRVCLARNSRMKIIANTQLQTTFEKISGIRLITKDGKPKSICYICFAQLQKCWKFREMSRKANVLLTKILHDGIEAALEKITMLDGKLPHKLSISTTIYTSIEDIKNENPEKFVKEELIGHTEMVSDENRTKDDPVPEVQMKTHLLKQEIDSSELDGGLLDSYSAHNEEKNIEARKTDTTRTLLYTQLSNTGERKYKYKCKIPNHQNHTKTHTPTKPFSCTRCLETFCTQSDLQTHILMYRTIGTVVKEGDLHICDTCGKAYLSKYSLKVHITHIHLGKKSHSCDRCNKTFNHRGTLRLHMRTHTGDKPYPCDKCSKTFSQKGTLQRHIRIHTGEKPYACHKCTKTFNQESSLKRHIQMHNGEKAYTCNRCGKSYYESSHLTRHMRTHTGEKPYACDRCFQTFSQSSNLQAHMKKHTGIKASNYVCHECNKTFDHKSIFKRHVLKHTQEKPYPCHQCNKKYADKRTLQRHILTHNQNE